MILNASCRSANPNNVEVLWELPASSTTLGAGHPSNLSFNPRDYDILYVTFYSTSAKEHVATFTMFPDIVGAQEFYVFNGTYCYLRAGEIDATGITFTIGSRQTLKGGSPTTGDSYAVPCRIYGVRYQREGFV